MSLIAAIDYSMTSPAVAICTGELKYENFQFFSLCSHHIPDKDNITFTYLPKFEDDTERFGYLADWVIRCIPSSVDAIVLEGYSMGSKGKVFNIGENTGILKYKLWKELSKTLVIVPPTVAKKFATGKGNADKQQMYDAFVAQTNVPLKEMLQPQRLLGSPTTDIIDAFFLAHLS